MPATRIITLIFLLLPFLLRAQPATRTLAELTASQEPAWPIIKGWIDSASNKVQILPADSSRAKEALLATQVTTRSPMGAIIYNTGGLLIDNGWIRILGSGSKKITRSVPVWNSGKTFRSTGDVPSFMLVADDVLGGFFAINGGAFSGKTGNIFYMAPDNLEWEDLDLDYTDFLDFCFNGDVEGFYKGLRWKNWKKDLSKLSGDEVFNIFPPLWTKEGKDIEKATRKVTGITEQYNLNMDSRKQLGLK